MRILIAEDDGPLGRALATGLRFEGFAVDLVTDGQTALEWADINAYDVIVLDRDLPVLHGDQVCKQLVAGGDAPPILMLTAAGGLDDKVSGFGLGADDYLVKPFDFPELVLRLRALSRRRDTRPPILEGSGIRLDPYFRQVTRNGVPVRLTRKEIAVLEVLLAAEGGVVSAETLLEKAWDANANPFTNSVRVTVSSLRRKLGEPDVIITVPGAGYSITGAGAGRRA